jgi:hypothetical protein
MERTYIVHCNGYLAAEISFNYTSVLGGQAKVVTYKPVQIEGQPTSEIFPVIPIAQFNHPFEVQSIPISIEEVEANDQAFFKAIVIGTPNFPQGDYIYSYDEHKLKSRYIVYSGTHLAGIATISAVFLVDKKDIDWVSATRITSDTIVGSNSLENNFQLLQRFAGVEGIEGMSYKELG